MPKFVEAHRGYINLELVAFLFAKENGDYVAYSAEGNEIGTIGSQVIDRLCGGAPEPAHISNAMAQARTRVMRKLLASNPQG